MLKCVPLDLAWTGGETKLDLKAIYRRRKQDNWGNPVLDADGLEQWDTTSGLPLRRHNAWLAKGFEYVPLADFDSLEKVGPQLTRDTGRDWREYIQDLRTRSPFSLALYIKGLDQERADTLKELRELVAEFGVEMVTRLKQKEQPKWQMPAALIAEFPVFDEDVPAKRGPGRPRKDVAAA